MKISDWLEEKMAEGMDVSRSYRGFQPAQRLARD